MKKLIVAAAMMAVSVANAEELKFGDVNYFIKQGQTNITFDANQTFEEQTDKAGETLETRSYLLSPTFAFGLTNQLNVFLGLQYAYDRETENKTTASNPDIHSDGLANPSLGVNYRLFNQNSWRYNVDFGAIANFKIMDAEKGSVAGGKDYDGNFTGARNSLELNARIGRKWNEANEWQLAAGIQHFFDGEFTTNGSSDVDTDVDGSTDIYVRATYQYRPVHEFMTLLSLQGTRVGEVDSKADGASTATYKSHIDFDFSFTAKYLVTENFIAKFNFGQSRNADFDIKQSGSNDEVRKRRENFFGLGVEFLF